MTMRILLVGNGQAHQVGAFFLRALGSGEDEYAFVDESRYFGKITASWFHRLAFHLLGRPLNYRQFNHDILGLGLRFKPQIIIVIKGAYLSPGVLARLRQETPSVLINYATDDPFNPVVATRDLLSGIPEYTLYACTKRNMINDVVQAGCLQAVFVPFGYDPSFHFWEPPLTAEEKKRFASDVVFIGGADADRVPIFRMLIKTYTMDLHLYGGYWNREAHLRQYYHGWAVGRDYRMALSGTKIALGLVRRANRDGHSMRTFEIPACGAFMLAERTDEHLEFFEEDKEAGYFGSNEELIEKTQYYLKHDAERQRMAEAAQTRLRQGHHTYRDRLLTILEAASSLR
jgi:spore maturation protein CgeB